MPCSDHGCPDRYGIDSARPTVLCVGRITRQKGIGHLLDAAREIDPSAQLVLRVGADTPELARDIAGRIAVLAGQRDGVIWIEESLDRQSLVQLLSHATVACCPSLYEPLGLVNVESMACETPVVASAVGGIPEIVEHGLTGLLVPFEPTSAADPEPVNPAEFARDLVMAINELVGDPQLAHKVGQAGRRRVIEAFSWAAVAARTVSLYRTLAS